MMLVKLDFFDGEVMVIVLKFIFVFVVEFLGEFVVVDVEYVLFEDLKDLSNIDI